MSFGTKNKKFVRQLLFYKMVQISHRWISLPTPQLLTRFCTRCIFYFFLTSDRAYIFALCHKLHALLISEGKKFFLEGVIESLRFINLSFICSLLSIALISSLPISRALETVSSSTFMAKRNTNKICLHDTSMPFFSKSGYVLVGTVDIFTLCISLLDKALSRLNYCLSSDTLIIFLTFILSCKGFSVFVHFLAFWWVRALVSICWISFPAVWGRRLHTEVKEAFPQLFSMLDVSALILFYSCHF